MNKTTLISDCTVRTDKDVVSNRLAEDFDFEDVGDDLLRLAVNVGVHQCDMVVASDHVSERRQSLLDTLKGNGIRECVS